MLIQLLLMAVMVSAASAACGCDRLEVTASSALNVRSGPSTGYGIIGQVYSGNCLSKLGSCGTGWDKISVSGQVGCVSSAYVKYTGPCACSHVIVSADVLNYRSGPYPAQVLGKVYKGNCFQVVGACGTGWKRIPKGCVSADYVQCTNACPASNSQSSTCMTGMCAGRKNEERIRDAYGYGHYGASRSGSTHKGSDVKCSAEEAVTAPFDGKVVRKAVPYTTPSCENDGFVFTSTDRNFQGISVKVFYVKDYDVGAVVKRGGKIGTHIGLHCKYSPSMTDHIHVEVYTGGRVVSESRVDPTNYLYCN